MAVIFIWERKSRSDQNVCVYISPRDIIVIDLARMCALIGKSSFIENILKSIDYGANDPYGSNIFPLLAKEDLVQTCFPEEL